MTPEIELISDGEGLAVIGDPAEVERFLVSEGLQSRDLGLPRLKTVLGTGGAAAEAGAQIAENSGRWVKITKESAELIKKYGLRESKASGHATAVVKGEKGQVRAFVEFARAPGSLLSNPAILTGAAGIMAQAAMQQSMEEITAYLKTIDEKVDDVLRVLRDSAIADMIGAEMAIDQAMIIRQNSGRVSEVTWSTVQATTTTIARTQAYALRQLDAIAEKLESKSKVRDLTTALDDARPIVNEWLAVLARCFQLQDALAILELDRVLDHAPGDLDGHRLGLKEARQKRIETISRTTRALLERMDAAGKTANAKVLLHPSKAPEVVQSGQQVASAVTDFRTRLGIDTTREALEARRWTTAAADVRRRALDTGSDGVEVARRIGGGTVGRAKVARDKLASELSERRPRRQ